MVKVTYKQILWLNQKGGRTLNDLFILNKKIGIFMMKRKNEEGFYKLPSDRSLILKGRKKENCIVRHFVIQKNVK